MNDDRLTDSFNDHAEVSREQRNADFDNLQHTLSGVDVGQQVKHGLRRDEIDPITGQKKDEIADVMWRTLEEWLRSPQYQADHKRLVDALREGVAEPDRLLDTIRSQLAQAHAEMDNLLSKAARLKDGRAVFRFADGRVEDEDGNVIDAVLTDHITWTPDIPSGEKYRAHRDRIDALEAAEREALGIQSELGDIYNRTHDNDNPYLPDDLPQQTDRVMDLRNRLDEIETNIIGRTAPHNSVEPESYSTDNAALSDKPIIKLDGKL